ncbi:MAG: acid phosphatase type 7 [Anaerophaga sp.]|nr:acid phosphatase type 7 [Anaerophaga sp.]
MKTFSIISFVLLSTLLLSSCVDQKKPEVVYDFSGYQCMFKGMTPDYIDGVIPLLPEKQNGKIKNQTIEIITLNHVNTPVGFCLEDAAGENILTLLNDTICLREYREPAEKSVQKYWDHWVITHKNNIITLYQNGIQKMAVNGRITSSGKYPLKIKAILSNEPRMLFSDLFKKITIYDGVLKKTEIEEKFQKFRNAIEEGNIPDQSSGYLVNPFVSFVSAHSANISWENHTNSTFLVRYGEKYPLQDSILMEGRDSIYQLKLENLQAGTNYYAEITDSKDAEPSQKVFFKTAPDEEVPFRFGVIADTESRPFINRHISDGLWNNRPDFFTILGDLTDGGHQEFKDQWTQEFFPGMDKILGRVPVFPVAGNGEGDLFWFNRFFSPPNEHGYYKFQYSNAEFFVLNSNQKEAFSPGGSQYEWLSRQLDNSSSDWKFVLLHHAPFSSDENDYGDSYRGPSDMGDMEIRKIVPLCEQYGVDMVMFGHLHCYERSWPLKNGKVHPDGVVYLQAGGGGGNPEDFAPHRTWFSAKTHRGYHYCIININNGYLRLDTYDLEHQLIDTFEKQKN